MDGKDLIIAGFERKLLPVHPRSQTSDLSPNQARWSGERTGSASGVQEQGIEDLLFFDVSHCTTIAHGDGDVTQDGPTVFASDGSVEIEVNQSEHNAHLLIERPKVEQSHAITEFLD